MKDLINAEPSAIKDLFKTKYYMKQQSSKIPFIYGSDEYIFSNLIYDTYETFKIKSTFPKKGEIAVPSMNIYKFIQLHK